MISIYAYHNWFRWLSRYGIYRIRYDVINEVLMATTQHNCMGMVFVFQKLSMCSVLFLPVCSVFKCFRSSHACHICSPFVFACAKSAYVFQKLSYSLCGLCLSLFSLITLPQTVRVSLHSQAPQQQYTVLSFSLMQRHGYSHKLTSSRALQYYTVGIALIKAVTNV